jgi:hypothetical protein
VFSHCYQDEVVDGEIKGEKEYVYLMRSTHCASAGLDPLALPKAAPWINSDIIAPSPTKLATILSTKKADTASFYQILLQIQTHQVPILKCPTNLPI